MCAYGIYLVHQPIISLWDRNGGAQLGPVANFTSAVCFALAGGFAFSYAGERPFLADGMRKRMVGVLERPLAGAFAFLGLPVRLDLAEPQRDAAASPGGAAAAAALEPAARR